MRALRWRAVPARAAKLGLLPKTSKQPSVKLHGDRPIGDYALIGSTHSAALVHRGGDIEWLCLPRFDSAAMFASLLGDERNGHWSMRATDRKARIARRYLPGTVVLETTIHVAGGTAVVTDFMPRPALDGTHEVVRIVRGVRGTVAMHTEFRIRFNYGEWCPWMDRRDGAVFATAGPDSVRISSGVPLTNENFASFADFTVSAGQSIAFSLDWFPSHLKPPVTRDANALLARTVAEWSAWTERCGYHGEFREPVMRSLLTLKALTYEPTGGIVAAPSASLPELPGGERNWDYRFCWLRDAALTLYALIGSGYVEEASAWRWWLMRAVGGSPEELQVMYGLHGERSLTELELGWLPGYEGSRPVRIGNGAHGQRQLDVYGSVIAAFHAARKAGLADMDKLWPLERAIAKQLMDLWREPDSGLWEVRGEPRHFVHSKVMCWLAFDRVIASATEFGLEGPVDRWREVRDEIHAEVCARGYDAASNSFMQYYGADTVDAALLWMPLIGFLPINDPRVQGTIARIEKELIFNGLVYRYRTEKGVDGLGGGEGAFLACSFWLANVYVAMGRLRKARALFKRLLALANDLGLYAEEYDPVARRQLGNFPQAFSHIGLINSAHALVSAAGGVWELADMDGKASSKKAAKKAVKKSEKSEKSAPLKRPRARTPRR
ncbi:Glucoamylase (glucan-1,4-alpha-glucosidase), GH15 family [Variovorax sp. NFACC28]|nr:Glucoamylase (glucan-1,4-alpha-glucosidase), GH15 family [Variovorax sp. NFACC28]SEG61434.1 Glucoamylase (glucan-1,4-alpha-glucosidase), GH15 family [Variovorax sp. NFACC29]SFC61577.1 Glucoamylase (glucan-1,4-alpha-glucosidase), GH15 family [Variovorax sp. NFACC26]SFG68264.1 Glucoamylase (glucan-1,4-alpha-glucosidase), GH15 family [Variovorax sp. NFACC27]